MHTRRKSIRKTEEKRSRKSKNKSIRKAEEKRSRKSRRKTEEKRSRKSKKPTSRFAIGDGDEQTPAQKMYLQGCKNHGMYPDPITRQCVKAQELIYKHKRPNEIRSNPEEDTYTVSRREFRDTFQLLNKTVEKQKKDIMLKSIYSNIAIDPENNILSTLNTSLLISPKYFYLVNYVNFQSLMSPHILYMFPNLISLSIKGYTLSQLNLSRLTNLKSLTILESNVSQQVDLSILQNLKKLELHGLSVLPTFTRLTNIINLNIHATMLLSDLSFNNLSNVQSLYISCGGKTGNLNLTTLSNLKNLRIENLSGSIDVNGLTKLVQLTVSGGIIIKNINSLENIKILNFNSISSIRNLTPNIPKIRQVIIAHVPATPEELRSMGIIYDTTPDRDDLEGVLENYAYDDSENRDNSEDRNGAGL